MENPVGAPDAWTVKLCGSAGGPVRVAQVTPAAVSAVLDVADADRKVLACMLPAQTIKASKPPSAGACFRNTDKSMEDLPFSEVFSTTSRGGDQSSNRYRPYRAQKAML